MAQFLTCPSKGLTGDHWPLTLKTTENSQNVQHCHREKYETRSRYSSKKETALNVSVKRAENNRYSTSSLWKINCGALSILYCIVLKFHNYTVCALGLQIKLILWLALVYCRNVTDIHCHCQTNKQTRLTDWFKGYGKNLSWTLEVATLITAAVTSKASLMQWKSVEYPFQYHHHWLLP